MTEIVMNPTAHFTRSFSAAHRIWNDTSKCHNIHGHNYRAEISVMSDKPTAQNFVIPFDLIKGVVDRLDHTLILDDSDPLLPLMPEGITIFPVPGPPSTEFLAALLAEEIRSDAEAAGATGVSVTVKLQETDSIEARAVAVS